jgi:hypothetical protein
MHLRPDPDFEEFALDCIRLSNEEKSPTLRRKLLTLAREWMHAAMHQQGAEIHRELARKHPNRTVAGVDSLEARVTQENASSKSPGYIYIR